MVLSQTCEIAIRSVAFIASNQSLHYNVNAKELSMAIEENQHTIAKVLQTLVRKGLLSSSKGPAGGFFLTKLQLKESIISIVKAIDGEKALEKCALGLSECSEMHPCPIHTEFKKARNIIAAIFEETKISNLSMALHKGVVFLH